MKKLLAMLLSLLLCLSMISCASTESTTATVEEDETVSERDTEDEKTSEEIFEETVSIIEVDEGFLFVDITFPASMVSDMTEEDIAEQVEEKGYSDYEIHEDGSVTYTMTKQVQSAMLEEYTVTLDELFEGLIEGESAVASFRDIQHNENFSEINVYIDTEIYSAWDSFYMLTFYISGSYYQVLEGTPTDDIDIVVNFIDDSTDEILNTGSYREYMENQASADEPLADDAIEATTIVAPTALEIVPQETITIDDTCEFFVDYTSITKDVLPPSPGRWYSHYEADTGKTYIDICIAYKNLATSKVGADDVVSATLLFGGQYTYTGFPIIEEDSRGDFTYANITSISPLETGYIHYLFEVPDLVETSPGALEAFLTIGANQYSIVVRESADGEVAALDETAVMMTSGELTDKQVVAINKTGEFYVDYTNITNDVLPPQPGSWYSHYEADDGSVYVDFCIAYKNWEFNKIGADDVMSAKLLYGGKYEYTGFTIIEEDSRGDFTYANITSIAPLSTEYLHYLFNVPAEVASSTDSLQIDVTIMGNTYTYHVR